MLNATKAVTDYSTWGASSDLTAINLPRDGFITEIAIRAAITMNGGTLGANVQPDGLRRVIQNLKIEGDGRTFLGLSGEQYGRLLAYWNIFQGMGNLHPLLDAATESLTWVFHPGFNPKDPFDTSVMIPAKYLSVLQAKLTTTANSVVDDTQTISSGYYYYTVNHVLDMPKPNSCFVPMGSSLTFAHDANYSDYSKDIDIPAGAWLRSIIMLVQDETATRPVRKDDEVTGVKIKMPKTGQVLLEARWEDLKAATARRFGVHTINWQVADTATGNANIPDGVAVIDLRPYGHPVLGLNLTDYQTGDFKLGLTIENYTSGDDTLIYWDQIQPMSLVGK